MLSSNFRHNCLSTAAALGEMYTLVPTLLSFPSSAIVLSLASTPHLSCLFKPYIEQSLSHIRTVVNVWEIVFVYMRSLLSNSYSSLSLPPTPPHTLFLSLSTPTLSHPLPHCFIPPPPLFYTPSHTLFHTTFIPTLPFFLFL